MDKLKKCWMFFVKPLKFKELYYKSNLGKAITQNREEAINKEKLQISMNATHKFYKDQFETFCKLKKLDPIEELQTRKTELEDEEIVIPGSIITSLFIGSLSSLAMHYILNETTTSPFINLIIFVLALGCLFYGSMWTYYRIYELKTFYPKGKILRQYELEVVSNLLDSYITQIKEATK